MKKKVHVSYKKFLYPLLTFLALTYPAGLVNAEEFRKYTSCVPIDADKEFEKYIPSGWKLLDCIKGNLNPDGGDDVVLVLEENNPKNYKKNEFFWGRICSI